MTERESLLQARPRVQYAVLWDLDDREGIPGDEHAAVPCGFVIERSGYVQVRLADGGYGIKERFDDPFDDFMPDGSRQETRPGDPDYFERVLYSLHQSFAISKPSRDRDALSAILTLGEDDPLFSGTVEIHAGGFDVEAGQPRFASPPARKDKRERRTGP
jgi:hypothetical protein